MDFEFSLQNGELITTFWPVLWMRPIQRAQRVGNNPEYISRLLQTGNIKYVIFDDEFVDIASRILGTATTLSPAILISGCEYEDGCLPQLLRLLAAKKELQDLYFFDGWEYLPQMGGVFPRGSLKTLSVFQPTPDAIAADLGILANIEKLVHIPRETLRIHRKHRETFAPADQSTCLSATCRGLNRMLEQESGGPIPKIDLGTMCFEDEESMRLSAVQFCNTTASLAVNMDLTESVEQFDITAPLTTIFSSTSIKELGFSLNKLPTNQSSFAGLQAALQQNSTLEVLSVRYFLLCETGQPNFLSDAILPAMKANKTLDALVLTINPDDSPPNERILSFWKMICDSLSASMIREMGVFFYSEEIRDDQQGHASFLARFAALVPALSAQLAEALKVNGTLCAFQWNANFGIEMPNVSDNFCQRNLLLRRAREFVPSASPVDHDTTIIQELCQIIQADDENDVGLSAVFELSRKYLPDVITSLCEAA